MKIMIDATSLARKITGIENYTKNLVEHIIPLNNNTNNELYILFRKFIPKEFEKIQGYTPIVCPFNSQVICEQLWIPMMKLKYQPDVMHFPAFPPSFLIRKNIYFTVHDATMWKYKETLSLKNKLYMKPLSNLGIKRAQKIITVSNSSLENITEVFPNISNKIVNCGISISNSFTNDINSKKLKEVTSKYKLPSNFFLTVGSLEPRKNLNFLIKTFIKFKQKNQTDYKLVITGRSAWGSEEVKKLIRDNNLENDVIFTGYISDDDLVSIYVLADYFVFPSIYEGFGLPVLEALACGTPVIISNTSSLPEVGGEAALYFDPYDEESLVEILEKVTVNQELKEQLSKRGFERRKSFSWNKVVKDIYTVYENNKG